MNGVSLFHSAAGWRVRCYGGDLFDYAVFPMRECIALRLDCFLTPNGARISVCEGLYDSGRTRI
jgi:hypothetical protein